MDARGVYLIQGSKRGRLINTRRLKGRNVYSHNCNNHNETDVLWELQNM